MTVNKEWMRKVLWIYLAAMAVILFCSKTIYTQSIPQVTAALPHAGVLSKELTESGVAEYAETVGVYAMSDGKVETVLVQEGEQITPGAAVLRLYSGEGVTADDNGVVSSLEKERGQPVSRGEKVATLALSQEAFTCRLACPEAEGNFVAPGDRASVTSLSSGAQAEAEVTDVEFSQDCAYITLTWESPDFRNQEAVSVSIQKISAEYDTLVPNEAVSREAGGNYVWLVRSQEGALGTTYYTVRRKVFLADSDDTNTAIAAGLEFPEPVILSHTRELTDNGPVTRAE